MTGPRPPLDCREVEQSLGVLVLGALDPAERPEIESHLASCARCTATLTELAPLPGLLHRLTPREAIATTTSAGPSEDLRRRLVDTARREERLRRRTMALKSGLAAAAAVVAIMLAATVVGVPELGGSSSPVTVAATDPRTHVRADVSLRAVATGTELTLRLQGVSPGERCRLVAVGAAGNRDVAATWVATYAGRAEVTGHTSIGRDRIERLLVVTATGRPLVELPVSA